MKDIEEKLKAFVELYIALKWRKEAKKKLHELFERELEKHALLQEKQRADAKVDEIE